MILRLARSIAEALRAEPYALALVIVNVLFLIAGGYVLRETAASQIRRDNTISELLSHCIAKDASK